MSEKPDTGQPKQKQVKMPEAVHALIVELQRAMGEAGQQAYWLRSDGSIVHGNVSKAPLHVAIEWAARNSLEFLHPDREAIAQGYEARAAFVKGFQEGDEGNLRGRC